MNDFTINKLETLRRLFDSEFTQQLPQELKDSPLTILEDSRLAYNSMYDPESKLEYENLFDRRNQLLDKLRKTLPENQKDLMCEIDNTTSAIDAVDHRTIYKFGLKDGFNLALELLNLKNIN